MIQITLPVSQENVRPELSRLREELSRVQAEKESIISMIEAVQKCCSHPDKHSGNTWGRWAYTACNVCGKEW